ncbi:MAG TPA: hypothetical protein VFA44_10460 [Gaiellaceae bacterium]|nr:hypothetical protein [Gaiellaceae bacterium]
MRSGLLLTPRPEPAKLLPALAAALVLLVALPVFLVAGWSLSGWLLGTVLWGGLRLFGLLLARLRAPASRLASSGVVAFGLMFKALAVLVVLVAVAASRPHLALAGTIVFALAYTAELALGLAVYFSGAPQGDAGR